MKPPKPRRNRQYFGSTTKIDDDIVVEEDFNNVKNGNNSNGVNADNKNNDNTEDKSDDKEMVMTVDELVSGALESAFWAMDKLILRDKEAGFRIRHVFTDYFTILIHFDNRNCIKGFLCNMYTQIISFFFFF